MWDAIKRFSRLASRRCWLRVKAMIGIVRESAGGSVTRWQTCSARVWDKVKGVFPDGRQRRDRLPQLHHRCSGQDPRSSTSAEIRGDRRWLVTRSGSGNSANATENQFAGGKVTAPRAIVGEEAPAHPEYVARPPTPLTRQRNLRLWQEAGGKLGFPAFAQGGRSLRSHGRESSVTERRVRIIDKFPSGFDRSRLAPGHRQPTRSRRLPSMPATRSRT